ncbi:hypothetical protein BD410DRAFT_737549 [Rickenella mellea]|uniref:Armadillo-like helical domain-containing protein n=1 Tax=Rickenella mellea TaxID=50990 RepID=A0A4Y7QM60_9AGAM|nr:hypothetical protein BD410DRAFT_737549 [Rickenella mellea]
MELFAGNVSDSDKVFLNFMKTTDNVLGDTTAPAKLRHQVLQLAITFACGINQLSPRAYLLRRNLVPAITSMINSPDTQAFTFEAVFLLAIVANFHKSDAAKLNPYLRSLKDLDDVAVMKTICWSANFALYRVIKAYQDISDDSPPTFATSVGSLFASLRPDRALSSTPIDPPRELFKNQPIQASVILLPLYEFVHLNDIFATVLVESILSPPGDIKATNSSSRLPLPHTVLTISSYILTHASSVSSRRAVAYANLCLHILLVAAENDVILSAFSQAQKSPSPVRLCRQRLPLLPILPPAHPLTCALLDCCVLWLKHNLHKRLEVHSYIICIWIVHRVIYFLCKTKSRLEYHWQELWRALLVLLDFLTNKLDGIDSRDGADRLVQETVVLIDFALCHAEAFLESPQAVHQFIYEVVRASSTLQKQKVSLQRSSMTGAARTSQNSRLLSMAFEALKSTTAIAAHYEEKIQASKGSSAAAVLRIIAKDVDRDGVHGGKDRLEDDLM